MKILVIASFVFFVTFSHSYETEEYYFPNINENIITGLGDTVISTKIGSTKDCVIPRKEFVIEKKLWKFIYKKDIPLCKNESDHKRYTPTYSNYHVKGVGDNWLPVSLTKNKNNKYTLCQKGGRVSCVKDLSEEDIEINKVFIPDTDYQQKQIIYLGENGNILKFLYEEENQTIPFEADISETSIISFKGAIFEIISNNNNEIEFKKIRHFRD